MVIDHFLGMDHPSVNSEHPISPSVEDIRERETPPLSRQWATVELAVGSRACVLPTGKFPPLAPLGNMVLLDQ